MVHPPRCWPQRGLPLNPDTSEDVTETNFQGAAWHSHSSGMRHARTHTHMGLWVLHARTHTHILQQVCLLHPEPCLGPCSKRLLTSARASLVFLIWPPWAQRPIGSRQTDRSSSAMPVLPFFFLRVPGCSRLPA